MDIVFNLRGHTYYIDTAVVAPFSSNAGLILETSGRPGYHAQKFIKPLYSDTDHPPTAIWDSWAASRPPCTTASPNNNSELSPRESRLLFLTTPHAFFHGPHYPQQSTSRSGAQPISSTSMANQRQLLRSTLGSHRAADVDSAQGELKGRPCIRPVPPSGEGSWHL